MICQNAANSHFSDQVNESDFKIRSPKSGPSLARLQDSAKLIGTTGSRTTKRHVVTGGIDASSNRLMSKQLHLQNNPFRHQHQQEQNQEMVLVRSLMWQANRQPGTQHQSHRGVDVRFEAKSRREDSQEGRSIRGWRRKTENRESRSSEE